MAADLGEHTVAWRWRPAASDGRRSRSRFAGLARDRSVRNDTVFAELIEAHVLTDISIRLRRVMVAPRMAVWLPGSGYRDNLAYVLEDAGEDFLEREDAAQGDVDAAHRDGDDGADLE